MKNATVGQSLLPVRALRRGLAGLLLALAAPLAPGVAAAATAATCAPSAWSRWDDFKQHFVQADGRVLDASTPRRHSSSEGQSYGMFFALVANDRDTFDRMWRWTVNNLAGSDISQRLPAWFWGLRDDGTWGVIDTNSASDADLWFVYALLEAARVWNQPAYANDARTLLTLIEKSEVAEFTGFGTMLLPGPQGFTQPNQWRANPSYLPMPVLRRLEKASPQGPWGRIADNTLRLVQQSSPLGYAPDWVAYNVDKDGVGSFGPDPDKGSVGSYDAIRTYLWAGITPPSDPLAKPMLQALGGLAKSTAQDGVPPEKVDVRTGRTSGRGPFGFSAALLPYLQASGQKNLIESQLGRVRFAWNLSLAPTQVAQRQPPYYDYVLSMFSTAWLDGRYRFRQTGQIQLEWEKSCPHAVTR
ncbi:cellulose synthase complex periplasmic endoglucanase BcsZ [Bordetella sp. N]|uniref:cellulose synthase complex periplasmic endoglucanase BcsZ n=1 Tax=Bordetella sp. N TaxID=1746199 RepID=UPI0007097917|nr:cellulose synthase complex periplasmic endoglucanase BcsZ [Bordetella sp. N]ALM85419.1 1,4-D-glucanase [Bordetella sp. N]